MMAQVNAGRVRFVGRGEYNNSTQYYVFDLVNYNGNSYYAKVDTIGHLPTDTTYWQLVAEKGNVGPTGPTGNGISSITKTSTSGLVDTYTITFTNGNTTTFDVTDGEITQEVFDESQEEQNEEIDRLKMLYNILPTTSGSGTDITLDGTGEVTLKSIDLKGNTSQNGTPTPEAPQDIQVVSGDNTIKVEGKNLFDINSCPILEYAFYDGNGNPVSWAGTCGIREYIKLDENSTYAIKYNGSNNFLICFYDENKTYLSQLTKTSGGNFTMPSTAKYIRFGITTVIANVEWCQIEKGSTATTYEPYQSQSYPVNLGDMELCKIGTYQDYIYESNGNWFKKENIGKVVLNGSEGNWTSWYNILNNNIGFYNTMNNIIAKGNDESSINGNAYCDKFSEATTRVSIYDGSVEKMKICGGTGNAYLAIGLAKTKLNDYSTKELAIASFKSWLSNNNTTLYYVLATPTTTEITDSTLINQLNNLEKAYSYDEQTNISQVNNDLPFIITAEAILSLKNILNI